MESDKFICVRETAPQNSVVIIDMASPMSPMKRPITADSAIMNPNQKIIALKAKIGEGPGDNLQIFNLEQKTKLKSVALTEAVVYWRWITTTKLGLVTATSVYHWDMVVCFGCVGELVDVCVICENTRTMLSSSQAPGDPVKIFDRTNNLDGNQIINYKVDKDEKWCVLIGIAPGAPERYVVLWRVDICFDTWIIIVDTDLCFVIHSPQLAKGNMQLYSVEQKRSQALEAHAAAFASVKVCWDEDILCTIVHVQQIRACVCDAVHCTTIWLLFCTHSCTHTYTPLVHVLHIIHIHTHTTHTHTHTHTQLGGSDAPSSVIAFAQKSLTNGQVISKVHIIEVGPPPGMCCCIGVYCIPLKSWDMGLETSL